MLSKGGERSARLAIQGVRVVCWVPVFINQNTVGQGHVLHHRDPDFAGRDSAGRHIEHDVLTVRSRHRTAKRIRNHAWLAPAPRHDVGTTAEYVHKMHRDKTGVSNAFRVGANAANMCCVT